MRRCAALGLAAALVAGACSSSSSDTTTTAAGVTTTQEVTTTLDGTGDTVAPPPATEPPPSDVATIAGARPRALAAFAEFEEVPLLEGGTYAGPATPTTLDDVLLAAPLRPELADAAVTGTLARNGFVIVPGFDRLFHTGYHVTDYDPYPVFVTTDAAYHVWHLVFSKVLREMEEAVLLPELEQLVLGLLDAARAQAAELSGSPLEEHAARVVDWFAAAATLLGVEVGSIGPRAAAEVELALDASEMTTSPVTAFGECNPLVSAAGCVDYTQFRPRGHYNRSEDLQRYFRAMSLLGQSGFFLDQDDSLAMGVLVAHLLDADQALAASWRRIYEPTAFLVGLADDYTPFEVATVAADVTPDGVAAPVELFDPAVLGDLAARLLALRDVGINPEAAAMRVMGARFVVDSFILDQLTWPNVGDEPPELRRVRPSPLDVAASFGSDYAYAIQEMAGETQYLHYDEQLARMQQLIEGRTASAWAATVYDAWLYALEPMWSPHGDEFPDFMRTEAWMAKAHQTGFGSYTELKHDTILYAKQGFAAEGGGEPPPFEPRHWVEPDPVAFLRIDAVAGLAQNGLRDRGLLPEELDMLLADLREFVSRLARIAGDELAGRPISEDDNSWLESVGSWLEYLWLASSDIDEETGEPSSDDEDAAVVADIFRNSFEILELGTGRIDSIYVLVPNDAGQFQVARGGVYSYYEFWRPADEGRLTDEEWRTMLEAGEAPERPPWQTAFLPATGDGSDVALPPFEGSIRNAESGLFCRDLNERGFAFADAVRYWWWDGKPGRMDADGNGIPCETVYPASEVAAFPVENGLGGTTYAGQPSGLFCRDLDAAGFGYLDAFQYWLWDGQPERMDADLNRVPCETIYRSSDVASVLNEVGWNAA